MDLYILRHAIAAERGTPGYRRDSDRPLTREGEKKMFGIARGMKALALEFDAVLSSPFARAHRTAEIVTEVLGGTVELCDALSADGDPRELIRRLQRFCPGRNAILLVGHEPYLSGLISTLLAGPTSVATTLKKGGLCKLSIHELSYAQCASLEWLLTPRQLLLFR